MVEGRIPPHDIDAEDQILGSLLIDGQVMEQIADILDYRDFYHEVNAWIFQACLSLYQRDEPINQLSVAHELENRKKLEAVGGAANLSHLIAECATTLDIEYHSETVHKLSVLRRLILTAEKISAIAYNNTTDPTEAIDKARMLLDDIQHAKPSRRLELGKMEITKVSPPYYKWVVNGKQITFSQSDVIAWGSFRKKVMGELDFIPLRPQNWEALVNQFLQRSEKEEAPIDTSPDVEAILLVKQRFEQRGEGWEVSDLRSGCYITVKHTGKETNFEEREYWVFQRNPLLRFLKRDMSMTAGHLWTILTKYGAIRLQRRIGKEEPMPIKLWSLPANFAEDIEYEIEKQEKLEIPAEEELLEEEKELPDI